MVLYIIVTETVYNRSLLESLIAPNFFDAESKRMCHYTDAEYIILHIL